jgi:hypothetical protein
LDPSSALRAAFAIVKASSPYLPNWVVKHATIIKFALVIAKLDDSNLHLCSHGGNILRMKEAGKG